MTVFWNCVLQRKSLINTEKIFTRICKKTPCMFAKLEGEKEREREREKERGERM